MSVATAQFLVDAIAAYLAAGVIFAIAFLSRWVGRVDPLAAHGTVGFRMLVFPGVTALWLLFAVRLMRRASEPPDEWTAHRALARLDGRRHSNEVRP
jgi:hypothetical protein